MKHHTDYTIKCITIGVGSNDEFLNDAELSGTLCKDFLSTHSTTNCIFDRHQCQQENQRMKMSPKNGVYTSHAVVTFGHFMSSAVWRKIQLCQNGIATNTDQKQNLKM